MREKKWSSGESKTDLTEIKTSEPISTALASYVRDFEAEITPITLTTVALALLCSFNGKDVVFFNIAQAATLFARKSMAHKFAHMVRDQNVI